jgi:tape measure domain-containing protein
MAIDMQRLVISLEARTKAAENQLRKSNAIMSRQLKQIEKQFADTNKKLVIKAPRMESGGGLATGAGIFAAGAAANEIRKYADAWTEAGNKIAAASQLAGRQGRSLESLNKIATATRSGLTETVDLYAKLLRSTKDVAKNEEEVARATEIINKAFKAGGAAASEQAAGILQLSQALGSGVLQGDELRSLRENAPLIAQAIADEFGTTISGLKELGAEGVLVTDRVFGAILKAGPKIESAFGKTKATIGDGITALGNALTEAIGRISEVSGAAASAGETLSTMASAIGNLTTAIEAITGSPAGKFLGFLNDVLKRIEPISAGLNTLAGQGIGKDMAGALTAPTAGEQEFTARRALARSFEGARNGVSAGFLTKEQGAALDELEKKLNEARVTAEEAKEEIARIGAMNPDSAGLLSYRFNNTIDALQEIIDKARVARDAITGVEGGRAAGFRMTSGDRFYSEGGRAAGFAMQSDPKANFLQARDAEAQRTELEKDIDTRTDAILKAADEVGVAISEAAARVQATKEIGVERTTKALDGNISDYVSQVVKAESGGNATAKNPLSSATGLGQFIESTWVSMFKKHFPARAESMTRAEILARRNDAEDSKALIEAYARENAAILQKAGVSVDAAALHLAHFLGPQGAIKALTADPSALAADVLGASAAAANPTIIGGGRTIGDVVAYGQKRAGMDTAGTAKIDSRENFANTLKEQQQYLDSLRAETEIRAALNPLVNDYGLAMSTLEAAQYLLTEAQREGTEAGKELLSVQQLLHGDLSTLSPIAREQALAMRELAVQTGQAEAAGEQLSTSQASLQDRLSESSALGKDVLGGFIRDLRDGKSATEALSGALDKVADKLLDMALTSLFDGGVAGSGGGPLGGLFGGLFSIFGFAKGGIAKNGKPLRTFAGGGVSRSAAIFGEAGPEAAVPLPDGRSIPVKFTGMPQVPSVPQRPAQPQGVHVTVGVSADNNGNLKPFVESVSRQESAKVTRAGIGEYDKSLNGSFGKRMSQAQKRQM